MNTMCSVAGLNRPDPANTQPRATIPGAAAHARMVSVAGVRLGTGESAKGIICDAGGDAADGSRVPEMEWPASGVAGALGGTWSGAIPVPTLWLVRRGH
jgi:hypothetical protein